MKNNQRWHPATVRAHRDLSPSVREFELRPEGGVQPWTVGSHLKVQVQIDGREETRTYSLVGLPHAPGAHEVYRIAVKRAEPGRGGSRWLWSLETGAELLIGEPNNHFELALEAPQFLLVAGGIGITPIVGMAQLLAERGADLRMRYAARHTRELAYLDTLRACLGERLQTFTDDTGTRLDLDAEIAALAPGGQLWICGPLPLLEAAREAWARAGRRSADLRFETFGNSGRFEAQPFWVELPRHGLRLTVPAERSLLDVLEEAGVDTLYDCRRGECGLCAMDIVRTEGNVDHRDVFFSPHEKQANERLCACVSRVSGGGVVLDSAYRPD
jgi:vanillate O-demethylase ferredoxin subunit